MVKSYQIPRLTDTIHGFLPPVSENNHSIDCLMQADVKDKTTLLSLAQRLV